MNNVTVTLFILLVLVLSFTLVSLWKNPPDGRTPRQRLGEIFHRLLTSLSLGIFTVYCGLCGWLYRLCAPAWLVNSVRFFVPVDLRRSGARAFQAIKEGGKL